MDIEIIKVNLPFENAPEYANVYLVNSVMIDGGFVSKRSLKELEEVDVKDVLITHHHIDHIGIIFWKEVNAYMHDEEIKFLEMYYNPEKFVKLYFDWMNKYGIKFEFVKPLASAVVKEKIKVIAKINPVNFEKLFGFKVILTPGHSPGHLCFYKDKILFSGDLILSDTTTHVGYYPGYSENPMKDQIDSLKKILKMEIDLIYPAHEKIIKKPEKRILELIEHYKSRINEVYSVLDEKPKGVVDIAKEITWHRSLDELTGWDKLLAIGESLACLKYLKSCGKVKEVENGIVKFLRN